MDEDLKSVEEEVTPQDQDSTIVEEQAVEDSEDQTQGQEDDQKERDWRALRKKAEASEQKARNLEEKYKLQEEMMRNLLANNMNQQTQPQKVVEEVEEIDQSDYPNYGQTNKLIEQRAEKLFEKKYHEMEQKREAARFRERLQAKYSDFDEVVNSETIELLEKKEPELASTIAELKDPYKMGLQTYNFLKSMNFSGLSDEKRHAKEVSKKLDKSEKTVQSPQAYNKRPMAQAFSMANASKDEKQRLYNEMMSNANRSSGY